MSVVIYRYKPWQKMKAPIITLGVKYGDRWFPVDAYVDSGATYSVFTEQIATRFGLDYRTGQLKYIKGASGSLIPIYLHNLELQIGKHRLVGPIAFSSKLGIGLNLLGRAGVFSYFHPNVNSAVSVFNYLNNITRLIIT